jgi:hypothetical protein
MTPTIECVTANVSKVIEKPVYSVYFMDFTFSLICFWQNVSLLRAPHSHSQQQQEQQQQQQQQQQRVSQLRLGTPNASVCAPARPLPRSLACSKRHRAGRPCSTGSTSSINGQAVKRSSKIDSQLLASVCLSSVRLSARLYCLLSASRSLSAHGNNTKRPRRSQEMRQRPGRYERARAKLCLSLKPRVSARKPVKNPPPPLPPSFLQDCGAALGQPAWRAVWRL